MALHVLSRSAYIPLLEFLPHQCEKWNTHKLNKNASQRIHNYSNDRCFTCCVMIETVNKSSYLIFSNL